MDQQDIEARFEKLETKLIYMEDFIARLQEEVVARNSRIEKLQADYGAIKTRLLQISQNLEELPDQKPPHY
jgi:SlyX protein